MQFYKIVNRGYEKRPDYKCTLKEAHDSAKEADDAYEVRVELIDIDTSKATLCSILAGWGCTETVLRTWKLTPRLGLNECPSGE